MLFRSGAYIILHEPYMKQGCSHVVRMANDLERSPSSDASRASVIHAVTRRASVKRFAKCMLVDNPR
jgi:hypothetical protein